MTDALRIAAPAMVWITFAGIFIVLLILFTTKPKVPHERD